MTVDHYVTGTVRTFLLQKQAEQKSGISDEEFWAAQHPVLSAAMESGRYPYMAKLDMTAFDIGPDPRARVRPPATAGGLRRKARPATACWQTLQQAAVSRRLEVDRDPAVDSRAVARIAARDVDLGGADRRAEEAKVAVAGELVGGERSRSLADPRPRPAAPFG